MDPLFVDRHDAGRRLAHALIHYKEAPDTLILALPRGGVVVGYEISRELHLPLEVLVTRKLGAPGNPELAMGALSETGYRHLNPEILLSFGVSSGQLEEEVRRQQQEIDRRVEQYRWGRPLPPMTGRSVILETPISFAAIGQFYLDFSQVADEEVIVCLERARTAAPGTNPAAE